MRYRKDGSCRYVTCCMNASTWAEYSKPQTLISFLNTQKWKENLLQTSGSRIFLGCAETKTEEGEKKDCTRKRKATVNFSARQSKISWIARQRKQRRYVDLYWRMDFFFLPLLHTMIPRVFLLSLLWSGYFLLCFHHDVATREGPS